MSELKQGKKTVYRGKEYPSLSNLWECLKAEGRELPAKSSFIRRSAFMELEDALDRSKTFSIENAKDGVNFKQFARNVSEKMIQENINKIVERKKKSQGIEPVFIEQSLDDIFEELN